MNKQNYIIKSILMVLFTLFLVSVTRGSPVNFFFSYSNYDYAPYQADFGMGHYNFDNFLTPYGYWMTIQPIGYVWVPRVHVSWRPYYYGYWVYTAYGPTWVAYEPWGWLTGHYGRWFYYPAHGWCWMPGYEWRPAWVHWVTYADYISWAPISPDNYHYDSDNYYYDNNDYYNNDNPGYYGYRQNSLHQSLYVTVNVKDFTKQSVNNYIKIDKNLIRGAGAQRIAPDVHFVEKRMNTRIQLIDVEKRSIDVSGKRVEYINPAGQLPHVIEESRKVQNVLRSDITRDNNHEGTKFIIQNDKIMKERLDAPSGATNQGVPAEHNRDYNQNLPAGKHNYEKDSEENSRYQYADNAGIPKNWNVETGGNKYPLSKYKNDETGQKYNENGKAYSYQAQSATKENNSQLAGNPVVIHSDSPRKYDTGRNVEFGQKPNYPKIESDTSYAGQKNDNAPKTQYSDIIKANPKNDPKKKALEGQSKQYNR